MPLYYRDEQCALFTGDTRTELASWASDSIDCVVTSPPHWGLRDYGTATWSGGHPDCRHTLGTTPHQRRSTKTRGLPASKTEQKRCRTCGATCHDSQLGLESTLNAYIEALRSVFIELGRVLTPRGTVWLNLRDSYHYDHNHRKARKHRSSADATNSIAQGVQHKSLYGIPWRAALALQTDGWIIRNAITWHKPNAMPDPATDRLSSRHEILFLFTASSDYFCNTEAVHSPAGTQLSDRRKHHYGGRKPHTVKTPWRPEHGCGRNIGDVWSLSTRPTEHQHSAAFPVDLPERCIASGCPENGTVLDPFSGSGTTGIATESLQRHYVGIDLRADYHDLYLARRRERVSTPSRKFSSHP